MRVLVVNYHCRVVGGVETYLRTVIPELAERVDAVGLLTCETGDPGSDGVPTLGVEWLTPSKITPDAVAAAAASWRPNVIYTHGLGPPEFEAELINRMPTVVYSHNYGGACVSGTKSHFFPTVTPCQRPLGLGCLSRYLPRRCGGLNPMVAIQRYGIERRRLDSFRQARSVLVASKYMADEYIRNGISAERVRHVPLPLTIVADASEPVPRELSYSVLFVGRVTALKGWHHLVPAVSRASARLGRHLRLIVAGDGPDMDKFKSVIASARISTEYLGWVSRSQRENAMRVADLLVVPSVWPEPFGLVGPEAGAVGLPAVAYEVGGIPEWLESGKTGELAPGDRPDPEQFAEAMVRALGDPSHYHRLRVGAWKKAQEFSIETHLARLLPILRTATGT